MSAVVCFDVLQLEDYDWVTGGHIGKTAAGVARRAQSATVSCICFCGGTTPDGIAALAALGAIVVPTIEQPLTIEEAIALGRVPLVRAAERAARLVSFGSVK